MPAHFKNVACPGCGCVCDDVALSFEGDQLSSFRPDCGLGKAWFQQHAQHTGHVAHVRSEPVPVATAVEESAAILSRAAYPLIYGLSRSATPGQRAAVNLADTLGAAIDTTASLCHGPSIMALQEVGEVTCTLGEVRNRSDLVVFWGCNPASSHPRHAERYSVFPKGRLTESGRDDRTVVMVGHADQIDEWRLDAHGTTADIVIAIEPGSDFEVLSTLRCLLHGHSLPDVRPELQHLHELMTGCRYGALFFGLGIVGTSMGGGVTANSPNGHIDVAALLTLVAELNAVTRFTARRMRLQGDVSGADNVLCWQTGYPFGVDFSRGYPRYNPGEYTANDLLARGDVDACLLVGAETVRYFSSAAREYLESIPTILLDYPNTDPGFVPTVGITTAAYGIHAAGTVYRMDNVPLPLNKLIASELPTDEDVLTQILSRLR